MSNIAHWAKRLPPWDTSQPTLIFIASGEYTETPITINGPVSVEALGTVTLNYNSSSPAITITRACALLLLNFQLTLKTQSGLRLLVNIIELLVLMENLIKYGNVTAASSNGVIQINT